MSLIVNRKARFSLHIFKCFQKFKKCLAGYPVQVFRIQKVFLNLKFSQVHANINKKIYKITFREGESLSIDHPHKEKKSWSIVMHSLNRKSITSQMKDIPIKLDVLKANVFVSIISDYVFSFIHDFPGVSIIWCIKWKLHVNELSYWDILFCHTPSNHFILVLSLLVGIPSYFLK